MLDLDIIEINDEQAHSAKITAAALSEVQIRKRGMIDMLGISCALNYLYSKKIRADIKRSVHKIPLLFEEFKITDIYYGNYRIDVITLYKEKTIKIPKTHVDYEIMPHFYFVVQIGSKIKEAKMIGFIDSKNIPACPHDSKYYYPTLDLIFNVKKFITLTKHSAATKTLLGKHIDCMGLFLKFIDNDLSSVYKRQLIQHLMNCDACRSRFIDMMEFEKLALNLRHYPSLIRKHEEKQSLENVMTNPQSTINIEQAINRTPYAQPQKQNLRQDIKDDIKAHTKETKKAPSIDKSENIYESKDKKILSKKVIESIFNDIPKLELPQIKTVISSKNKRALIVLALALVFLCGFALISLKNTTASNKAANQLAGFEAIEGEQDYDDDYYDENEYYNGNHQAKLIPKERSIDDFTIKQPISTRPAYSPSVARVSWEAPESLIKKPDYTKFLQLTGKNLKLNLQNDLLLVNDVPVNRLIAVDIKISSSGEVNSIKLRQTSGSRQIDDSIIKVVSETLKYMKPPSHGIISRAVDVTLSVELN